MSSNNPIPATAIKQTLSRIKGRGTKLAGTSHNPDIISF